MHDGEASYWFQIFQAHDISQTSSVRLEDGNLVQCCSPEGKLALSPHERHFACMPIHVDPEDEFFASFGVRCLNFVRLSLVPSPDCQLGYGRQLSKVTHFIDASPVYGSSEQASRDLRAFQGGRLEMLNDFGRELLPLTNDKKACPSEEAGKSCFNSGKICTPLWFPLYLLFNIRFFYSFVNMKLKNYISWKKQP